MLFEKLIEVSSREVGRNNREEGQVLYSLQNCMKCFNALQHILLYISVLLKKQISGQKMFRQKEVMMSSSRLVGNKIDANKSYRVTTTFSAIPRDQSLWRGSTMLCLFRRSYQCQGSEGSWVQDF